MKKIYRMMTVCVFVVAALFLMTSTGWAQKVVKIGFIGPLTGPNAAQGVGARNAFDLAIREANASGKYPFKIEMVALDDASDPATGMAAALKLVSDPAVAEVVWVLESFYEYSKEQIAETMTQFLMCEGLEVESLDLLIEALSLYHEKNLDFADAVLAITALRKGPKTVYSFDRHLNRVDGLKRLEPGHGNS